MKDDVFLRPATGADGQPTRRFEASVYLGADRAYTRRIDNFGADVGTARLAAGVGFRKLEFGGQFTRFAVQPSDLREIYGAGQRYPIGVNTLNMPLDRWDTSAARWFALFGDSFARIKASVTNERTMSGTREWEFGASADAELDHDTGLSAACVLVSGITSAFSVFVAERTTCRMTLDYAQRPAQGSLYFAFSPEASVAVGRLTLTASDAYMLERRPGAVQQALALGIRATLRMISGVRVHASYRLTAVPDGPLSPTQVNRYNHEAGVFVSVPLVAESF